MVLLKVLKKAKRKKKEIRVLILGLDNAGKTTIVKRLKHEDVLTVSPTFGFQIETYMHNDTRVNIWDVGGQKTIRPFWRNYFESTDGLIWVVDSTDEQRIISCRNELMDIISKERLLGATILIMANKQDLPGAMSCEKISELLQLDSVQNHNWRIQPCSAITGDNVHEAFNWFIGDICNRVIVAY